VVVCHSVSPAWHFQQIFKCSRAKGMPAPRQLPVEKSNQFFVIQVAAKKIISHKAPFEAG
jgi:hypothetical protein